MFHLKISKTFIVFLFFLLFVPKIYAIVDATNEFYVNDYANVLSADTEKYILDKSVELYKNTSAQIVVVTVDSLEGLPIEDYALKLFRKFGIGSKDKDNGLLILLSVSDRELRVEIGYGLEGILPDSKVGRLEDNYMIPYLKNNDWNNGIKSGYDAFYDVVLLNYDENVMLYDEDDIIDYDIIFLIANIFAGMVLGIVYKVIKANAFDKSWIYKFFLIYFCVLLICSFIGILFNIVFNVIIHYLMLNVLTFIFVLLSKSHLSGGGHSSGGSLGGLHRTSSRHRGGGGSSGGGGASRRF